MGRWIPEECGKIVDDTSAFLGRANGGEEARALCEIHNTDRDAYEERIAELEARLAAYQLYEGRIAEFGTLDYLFRSDSRASKIEDENNILRAELARVKAESLRVVEDGKAMRVDFLPVGIRVSIPDRIGVYRRVGSGASAIPEPHSFVILEDCNSGEEINVPYGTQGYAVRLERWETEDGN